MVEIKSSPVFLVVAGAIPGAIIRYLLGSFTPHFFNLDIGTLIANVLGSLILGILVTMFRIGVVDSNLLTMIGIGFCGSLTTMSTFAVESIKFLDGSIYLLVLNVLLTLVLVFLGAYIGRILAIFLYLGNDD